ncbi:hypothetical protein HMPREF9441_01278 [Paraprevotella clara YIT 11840]|uniref:Uncharacterized protein n=1 Tax=Paraprevotella clara YIT 11840 TaxID=762968 RepID=G5SPJ5_9BACT|nr:hypothetical protein HMPREF9441_01278 [Paraprevotella clara YIT 11840]
MINVVQPPVPSVAKFGSTNCNSGPSHAAHKGKVDDVAPHSAMMASNLFFISMKFKLIN